MEQTINTREAARRDMAGRYPRPVPSIAKKLHSARRIGASQPYRGVKSFSERLSTPPATLWGAGEPLKLLTSQPTSFVSCQDCQNKKLVGISHIAGAPTSRQHKHHCEPSFGFLYLSGQMRTRPLACSYASSSFKSRQIKSTFVITRPLSLFRTTVLPPLSVKEWWANFH